MQNHSGGDCVALRIVSLPPTSLSSVPSSTSAFSKSNITTTNNNKSWVGRRAVCVYMVAILKVSRLAERERESQVCVYSHVARYKGVASS